MMNSIPLPPVVPLPAEPQLADIEDAALELYQRVVEAERRAEEAEHRIEEAERRLRAEMTEKTRRANRLIAVLASVRFEFVRLVQRLWPELQSLQANNLMELCVLFLRSWDSRLHQASIRVVDLTGLPLTDELAGDVEVESHVPDPSVAQAMVRETLAPLVLLEGKVIGMAKIVTSVPETKEENVQ